jgi:ribose transport system permease protein
MHELEPGKAENKSSLAYFLNPNVVRIILLMALVLVGAVSQERFLTKYNLINIINQSSALAILAFGQGLVILTAGIDLSMGAVLTVTNVLLASYSEQCPSLWLMLGGLALLGILVGFINGWVIAYRRVPPFIMTLGMSMVLSGIALYVSPVPGGVIPRELTGFLNDSWGGIPVIAVIVLALMVLLWFLTKRTRFGLYLYALGGSERLTRHSGINAGRLRVTTYMISGLLAVVAGLWMSARIYTGDPRIGDPFVLDSIAAVVLGGIPLSGGRGSIVGVLTGAITISLLSNILNMMRVAPFFQPIIKGMMLILALALFALEHRQGQSHSLEGGR